MSEREPPNTPATQPSSPPSSSSNTPWASCHGTPDLLSRSGALKPCSRPQPVCPPPSSTAAEWNVDNTNESQVLLLGTIALCENAKEILTEGRNVQEGNGDDRISTLPNDILVNILDRLNVCQAVRTSILSRRWSQLLPDLSRLTISARDFMRPRSRLSDGEFRRINAAVVEATKSILACRAPDGCTIRLLRMAFYLRDDAPVSLGRTVGNAMATHKIEEAEFTVWTVKGYQRCTMDDVVNYGSQFVSFFNECLNAFAGLTRLYMENLRFAESDFVSNILGTCKQLRYLGFLNCGTESFIELQVEHAELKEFSIVNCGFDKVELKWLPRLTRTTFVYWMSFAELPLSFGHVPLLEFLYLSNVALSWHKMVNLSTLLFETSVQELYLGFTCEKIWVQPESLTRRLASAFHLLRIVTLLDIPENYDLTWTMFILEAAPSLEEFYILVMDHPCAMEMDTEVRRACLFNEKKGVEWESPTSKFKHHRLTKLVIFCFESKLYMVSHVRRVMKAAVNLKDVYLYNRLPCRKCVHHIRPSRFPLSEKQRCLTKKIMTQGIKSLARIHFLNEFIIADHLARVQWDQWRI